mgnify:FL=1
MMSQEELHNTLSRAFEQNTNLWVTDHMGYLHRYHKVFVAGKKLVILESRSNYDTVYHTGIESKLFKYQTEKILA